MRKTNYLLYILLLTGYSTVSLGMTATRAAALEAARAAAKQAVGDEIFQRAEQAATGIVYVQAARQTKQDIANIATLGREKIEQVLTYLAANVAKLLDDLSQSTQYVNADIDTLKGVLSQLEPTLAQAYQQAPGAEITPGEGQPQPSAPRRTLGWLTSQAARAAAGAGRLYERGLQAVYGPTITKIALAPAKGALSAFASLKNVAQRMLDNRKYLVALQPQLQQMDQAIDSIINNLQTMQITIKTILQIIPELPQESSLTTIVKES